MKSIVIKEIMVPLEEYVTVSHGATLLEAVAALENIRKKSDHKHYRHRAILVLDENNQFVGKLSQHDVLMALEPKYNKIIRNEKYDPVRYNSMSDLFSKYIMDEYSLWEKPLDNLCQKAVDLNVRDIMYTPSSGEIINENATMDEAIHKFVIGKHLSLLVTRDQEIVGIVRLTDVFVKVSEAMKECRI